MIIRGLKNNNIDILCGLVNWNKNKITRLRKHFDEHLHITIKIWLKFCWTFLIQLWSHFYALVHPFSFFLLCRFCACVHFYGHIKLFCLCEYVFAKQRRSFLSEMIFFYLFLVSSSLNLYTWRMEGGVETQIMLLNWGLNFYDKKLIGKYLNLIQIQSSPSH